MNNYLISKPINLLITNDINSFFPKEEKNNLIEIDKRKLLENSPK